MKRRSFLAGMLAAAAAPAIVQSGILMPVKKIVRDPWGPEAVGDRIQEAWEEARCWPGQDQPLAAIRYGIYEGPGHTHDVTDPGHSHGGIWQPYADHIDRLLDGASKRGVQAFQGEFGALHRNPTHQHYGPVRGQIGAFTGPLPVGWQECDGLQGRPDLRAFRRSA